MRFSRDWKDIERTPACTGFRLPTFTYVGRRGISQILYKSVVMARIEGRRVIDPKALQSSHTVSWHWLTEVTARQ